MGGTVKKVVGSEGVLAMWKGVNAAWLRALGRLPDDGERSQAIEFLDSQGLDRLCLLLFNLNEFIYVD